MFGGNCGLVLKFKVLVFNNQSAKPSVKYFSTRHQLYTNW
jgi:hypothetical protein